MTQVTVKELAQEVNMSVDRLLEQMKEAGLSHQSAEQTVNDTEKQKLLSYLQAVPGKTSERKITLQRKKTSTIRNPGSKAISVEVRKKKTFVQRSAEDIEAEKRREQEAQRVAAEKAAAEKAAAEKRAADEAKAKAKAEEREKEREKALAQKKAQEAPTIKAVEITPRAAEPAPEPKAKPAASKPAAK